MDPHLIPDQPMVHSYSASEPWCFVSPELPRLHFLLSTKEAKQSANRSKGVCVPYTPETHGISRKDKSIQKEIKVVKRWNWVEFASKWAWGNWGWEGESVWAMAKAVCSPKLIQLCTSNVWFVASISDLRKQFWKSFPLDFCQKCSHLNAVIWGLKSILKKGYWGHKLTSGWSCSKLEGTNAVRLCWWERDGAQIPTQQAEKDLGPKSKLVLSANCSKKDWELGTLGAGQSDLRRFLLRAKAGIRY